MESDDVPVWRLFDEIEVTAVSGSSRVRGWHYSVVEVELILKRILAVVWLPDIE